MYVCMNKHVRIEVENYTHFAQWDKVSEKFLEHTVVVTNPTVHITSEDTRFE